MRPRLHMFKALELFAWTTITGMLLCVIQKPHCQPPPALLPTPTFSHAEKKQKTVELPISWFLRVSWSYKVESEARRANLTFAWSFEAGVSLQFTSLFVWPSLLWREVVYSEALWKDEMKWVLLAVGLRPGMAGIVRRLDRLQSTFWSCWGQTLLSPPCVGHITSPNTFKAS